MTTLQDATTQFAMNSGETRDALVGQKNILLSRINSCEDHASLLAAKMDLLLVTRLCWDSLGYGYKARELALAIKDRARVLIRELDIKLAGLRGPKVTARKSRSGH